MEKQEKIIYPKCLDEYFIAETITIKLIPDKYRILKQDSLPDRTFKNTRSFVEFIKQEMEFWSYEEAKNNHMISSYKRYFQSSLNLIQSAVNYGDENRGSAISNLQQAIYNFLTINFISSKTLLAKELKKYKDENSDFFYGFESAITSSTMGSINALWLKGYHYGLEYAKAISSIEKTVKEYDKTYLEAAKNAEQELSSYAEKSTNLFHEQEEKIKALWESNKQELENQKAETNSFIKEKNEKLDILEDTYNKKLQLSKPAEYWKKLAKLYMLKGFAWFIFSFVLAVGIVAGIVFLIINTPQLFQANKYWLDLIKDTALLTVITSVTIYILRITVKMAISSFNLSRDAKEREMLTGFYLSLNNENKVLDSERVIIINSLFSRADTGLLKGDSSPTMLENIAQLHNKDNSK